MRVAVEAEDLAACGCDALRRPLRFVKECDGGVAYGLEAGEAIGDLGLKNGVGGVVGLCWRE